MDHDLSNIFSVKGILIYLLVMTRISGLLVTAPLFSTYPIPVTVKAGLAAFCAFVMFPMIAQNTTFVIPHDLITMTMYLAKEFIVGALIGFCAGLIFVAIQVGGQMLSMQMGLTMAQSIDPVTHQNVPIVGQFYLYTASLVFLFVNGHLWLFSSLNDSYNFIPIGIDFSFAGLIVDKVLIYISYIFSLSFRIVVPIFGLLFISDISMAFMAKLMPKMNIFMVGIPLKIYVGLLFMSLFIIATADYLARVIPELLQRVTAIFI